MYVVYCYKLRAHKILSQHALKKNISLKGTYLNKCSDPERLMLFCSFAELQFYFQVGNHLNLCLKAQF